jgi:hypothetical protein
MSWAKLDDRAYSHRKFLDLDPAAIGLWAMGLSYCAGQLTDGRIPKGEVKRLISVSPAKAMKLAAMLVKRELWKESDEEPDVFIVNGWLECNMSRAEYERDREQARKRQQEFRDRRNGVTNGVTHGVSHSSPTRPDPTREEEHPPSPPRRRGGMTRSERREVERRRYTLAAMGRLNVEQRYSPEEINAAWEKWEQQRRAE